MNLLSQALREAKRLRMLACALELLHYERSDSACIPIPGTAPQRYILVGDAASVLELLPELRTAVPTAWREFARAIADLPAGAEPNLDGMRSNARQLLTREEQRPALDFLPELYRWLARAHFERPADEATAARFGEQIKQAIDGQEGGAS